MLKIALIEPFYGGSHQYWCDNLVRHSQHEIELVTMSDAHWKWRMEGGAMFLVSEFLKLNLVPNLFLVTDMLNVALFRSLLPEEFRSIPVCVYFHENQLTYPIQTTSDRSEKQQRDYHYGFINYSSALVSDFVCFNSAYNKSSFLTGIRNLLKMMPDKRMMRNVDLIAEKSRVIPVGISDDSYEYELNETTENRLPIILWNHRWEHDKNPELFFKIMKQLRLSGIQFQLIICGEHSGNVPPLFMEMRTYFSEEIIHFGFVESRTDYLKLLDQADVMLVTSLHEFFGISVLEAAVRGCIPILPNRLSYPEIFKAEVFESLFYHSDEEILAVLKTILLKGNQDLIGKRNFTRFKMSNLVEEYDQYFNAIIND